MKFEWDEKKNEKNRQKHGVWFEEAKNIFSDPYHRVFLDSGCYEDRYIAIGFSGSERLLVIVFCYKKNESVIRIISARKATKKERRFYEKGI